VSNEINQLIDKIRALEEELEVELAKCADELRIRILNGNIEYSEDILAAHQAFKRKLARYVLDAHPLTLLSAPLIYGLIFPLLLLDGALSVYQAVCFPIYDIPKVARKDYLIFDRSQLAYLNLVEKLNCAYCSYGNGLIAYAREIAARTEQYWCPIKHASRVRAAHARYSRFADYGDAEAYHASLMKIRKDFEGE
jgi:hypothetical protein